MIVNRSPVSRCRSTATDCNVRDWLFVDDHCRAVREVLARGQSGRDVQRGRLQRVDQHRDRARSSVRLLDEMRPDAAGSYSRLINFVTDRPGHDRRYAIDARKLERELGWIPAETFESGIRKTVRWYLDNADWVDNVQSGSYRDWVATNYGDRARA